MTTSNTYFVLYWAYERVIASLFIMDDDLDAAESRLSSGQSQFHNVRSQTIGHLKLQRTYANCYDNAKLALGLVTFLKASLGLEHEIMREGI